MVFHILNHYSVAENSVGGIEIFHINTSSLCRAELEQITRAQRQNVANASCIPASCAVIICGGDYQSPR